MHNNLDVICFEINSIQPEIFHFKLAHDIDFNKGKSGAVEI